LLCNGVCLGIIVGGMNSSGKKVKEGGTKNQFEI
jgi:hypothetical protein